jgi:hypothetical protein
MSPEREGEQQCLKDARAKIWRQIDIWLATLSLDEKLNLEVANAIEES